MSQRKVNSRYHFLYHISLIGNKAGKFGCRVLQESGGLTGLDYIALLHHENSVTAEDGVDPVSDGDDCSVPETLLDHLLYLPVSLRINISRGLLGWIFRIHNNQLKFCDGPKNGSRELRNS